MGMKSAHTQYEYTNPPKPMQDETWWAVLKMITIPLVTGTAVGLGLGGTFYLCLLLVQQFGP